jgi:threonylcarbamoyladenosine tRNA methylthiotransferase MtaB
MIPLAGIGADVIVGFPGESETDFEATRSFLENLALSYLHIFSYSQRPGTKTETLADVVSHSEKERRSKILIALSESKNLKFSQMNIGESAEVLFEMTKSEGLITGLTENYLRVEFPWQAKFSGKIVKVKITGIADTGRLSVDLLK